MESELGWDYVSWGRGKVWPKLVIYGVFKELIRSHEYDYIM